MVTVGSVLYYLVSLYLTPHHEGVHGSLHVVNSIPLELCGVRVGGGGGGVDVVTGQTETHGCGVRSGHGRTDLHTDSLQRCSCNCRDEEGRGEGRTD